MNAGTLLCALLLASTPNFAQQIAVHTPEPPKSIISLASAPRPQGQVLARHTGDATFAHVPANYHVFAAANAGEDAGVEALTLNFAAQTRLTKIQSKNKDFVVEPGGTCHEGNSYGRGDSCTLLVRFNPQGPGHRLGFVSVSNSAEASPMSFGLTGNGYAPVISFTPSQISTVASTVSSGTGLIKSATNMTIDGGDILYIADIGNAKIKEIDSTGVLNSINPAFATPQSIAADNAGILYSTNVSGSTYYFSDFTPWGVQTAFGYTYTSTNCTVSAPCAFSTVGMSSPANISIDNSDNLFMLEGTTGSAEMPVSNLGQGTGTLNLWHLKNQFAYASGGPGSFAVDQYGDLFTNYTYTPNSTCVIYEENLYDAEYSPSATRVAGALKCGFSGDGGQARGAEISTKIGQMAFDIAGNMYFADTGNQRVRRVDASTGIISTIAGNGTAGYIGDGYPATLAYLSNPTGVAVDSQGQVYILSNAPAAGPTQVLRKVGTQGSWTYGNVLKGTSSSPYVLTVANTGNSVRTLSVNAFWAGNTSDFSIDPITTSCVLTAGATLAAGRSCTIGIVFKPTVAGNRAADLHFPDNTVTGSDYIHVWGTGTLPAPTMSITSPTGGGSATHGTTVTFAVSVTSTSATKPTGTVTFKVNGTAIGSPVTLNSSGVASTTFTESTASTYTLSAVYSGDANFSTATVLESFIFSAIPVVVNLTPTISPQSSCGARNFSVKVSSTGASPTGSVQLKSGSSALASADLSNGAAVLSAAGLAPGKHSFIASYGGDSLHNPGTSTPVSIVVPATASCGVIQSPHIRAPFDGMGD
jgi:hypothetical protein